MLRRTIYLCFGPLLIALVGCDTRPRPSEPEPSATIMQLSFEERMAIRARLTVIDAEAKDEASSVHDKFSSKDAAIAYEDLVTRLKNEKQAALLAEHNLSEMDLDYIVNEYLQSQGVEMNP